MFVKKNPDRKNKHAEEKRPGHEYQNKSKIRIFQDRTVQRTKFRIYQFRTVFFFIVFNKEICIQNFKKCLKDQNKNKIWQKNINTNAQ